MKQQPLEVKISQMVEPVIEDLGFSLYCVKMTGDAGATILQIMAEDPATSRLGVDDCAKISRAVSAILDVEDPIKSNYRLEISSPGIDRFLMKPEHFEKYKGFEAKLETDTPAENGQRKFRGVIANIENEKILVKTDTGDVEIPYHAITKAKLVMTDELIKATSNR